jgi:murein tripeptide amidase MpaA
MYINSRFDSGNIECVDCNDPSHVRLRIRKDTGNEHMQWFFFQVLDAEGQACALNIENAGDVSYSDGFENYQACASYDREHWFRVPTQFDGRTLSIHHTPDHAMVWYAYFAPYTLERHHALISDALDSPLVSAETLCITPDGHPLTLLTVDNGSEDATRKTIWVTCRQHPGESMAEWWAEGFLDRLLDPCDPVARKLLDQAVIYVVPNMNPDGSVRGHLRCNALGRNLNRHWETPDPDQVPEVYYVKEKMKATGIDLAYDVHGDEGLPYNFIAGAEGTPSWNDQKANELETFLNALKEASPDFQTKHGYPVNAPGEANLSMCTAQLSHTFDCLAMTLEMPFKDNDDAPMPEIGWSPERCRKLGEASLDAMLKTLPVL